jgi:hypothetical protein
MLNSNGMGNGLKSVRGNLKLGECIRLRKSY